MKELIGCALLLILLALSGCALNCGEMMGKDTMWASGAHAWSSLANPDRATVQDAKAENADGGWWGCPVQTER